MFFDLYVLSPMNDDAGFIPPHGNYRELLSYRKAEIVYDLTYRFCHRFLALLVPAVSDAPLAQLAEQVTLNHWVVGSIPTRCIPQRQRLTLDGSRSP